MYMINLGTVEVRITQEDKNVRLIGLDERISGDINIVFLNQSVNVVAAKIEENFSVVKAFYKVNLVAQARDVEIDSLDLDLVCIKLVNYFFRMYNSWRNHGSSHQSLGFELSVLGQADAYDIIIRHFKARYPSDWMPKVGLLVGRSLEDLEHWYIERQKFYNK